MTQTNIFVIAALPDTEIVAALKSGLPAGCFADLVKAFKIPSGVLASKIHLAERTVNRKKTDKTPLSLEDSEKILRLARIRNIAAHIFSNDDVILDWMKKPAPALDGVPPLDMLETETGARQVEGLLRGIANGHIL